MSNIAQDGREQSASLLTGNTTVYVTYNSTGFYWGTNSFQMQPLADDIKVTSKTSVTFELVRTGANIIWYKLPPTAPAGTVLPTSNGPNMVVAPGGTGTVSFANTSGGPYFAGSVTVSDDGFDDLAGGGDDSSDSGEQ